MDTVLFQKMIWAFYQQHGRAFAWRNVHDPYRVVVSEIMLQQTQTHRVEKKYEHFTLEFPSFKALAEATLRDVLSIWQGLGYNRRGKALQAIAQKVEAEYAGVLPDDPLILETFPGIGSATAGSICAFAFNKPTIFIETNIRTVYLHSFFAGKDQIGDKQLLPFIEQTVDMHNPREWYYALMDYGVHLKKLHKNPNRRSLHYTKQSAFEGSDRQIRGLIIKLLTNHQRLSQDIMMTMLGKDEQRVKKALMQLCSEGILKKSNDCFFI